MGSRRSLVAAAIGVVAGARLAHADHADRADPPDRAEQETVELRYTAPPGCPERAVVEAEIVERTPNVRLAAPARRVFAITIEATPAGFHGTLVVDRVADKELAAPRCEDLATALALVTALAIDPTATVVARAAAPADPPPRPPSLVPASPGAWSFEADLGGMVEAGVSPDALFAAVLEGRVTWRRTYQLELAAIAGRDSAAQAAGDDAQARFTWLAARPAVCRMWHPRRVELGACGDLEVGVVRARGEMIVNQRDLTRLWLAAGLHGSARVAISARVFGQLQLGAAMPLVRDRYLFAPNVAIHETPSVTGWMVVGVGVRFP
jgi:hypothetical protein